jgi:hypothetical protein
MSGGRASRDKGNRCERAIVRLLQEHGLAAERVPLSGSARGRFGGDISVAALGRDLLGEAKARGSGFNRLYDWLEDRDFLVLRTDRKPLLVHRFLGSNHIRRPVLAYRTKCGPRGGG